MLKHLACGAGVAAGTMFPAAASPVTLAGVVVNSCVLAVPTTGLLVADATGTSLRSDAGVGARPATMTVVAVGTRPTLSFGAPQYAGSAGVSADTTEFSYRASGSGASRTFAATSATATSNLIDTFTINGKIDRADGFPTGTYNMTIDVTCSQ